MGNEVKDQSGNTIYGYTKDSSGNVYNGSYERVGTEQFGVFTPSGNDSYHVYSSDRKNVQPGETEMTESDANSFFGTVLGTAAVFALFYFLGKLIGNPKTLMSFYKAHELPVTIVFGIVFFSLWYIFIKLGVKILKKL